VPTFTDFIPTFPTVNRKFLITDFRLLSTSVKRENFIDFYRSQKKVKDPRSLRGKCPNANNLCLCLCLYLSVSMFLSLCTFLLRLFQSLQSLSLPVSVSLSVCLFVCLAVCLSLSLNDDLAGY
jgi:hypothetical protein